MENKLLHVTRIPIRWGDMDAFGHVNNTVYFRYMEQARIEWMEENGMMLDASSEGPVIINARCSFLQQLKYPGEVEVRTYAALPGRSSFETTVEMRRTDCAEVLVAEGGAKVVWVNYREEKSVPLPDSLRTLLETSS